MSQGVLKGTCLLVGGLCSCPVICLPSCVPELAPIDVEPGQDCIFLLISQTEDSPVSVHVVERAPQNGCHQFLCPQGHRSCSCPLLIQETLQNQQVSLTQPPIPAFSLDHVRVKSLFPQALWDSQLYALLAFKVKFSGGLSFWSRIPGLGSLIWG